MICRAEGASAQTRQTATHPERQRPASLRPPRGVRGAVGAGLSACRSDRPTSSMRLASGARAERVRGGGGGGGQPSAATAHPLGRPEVGRIADRCPRLVFDGAARVAQLLRRHKARR
eukprot:4662744-Prymnesium_polylepis.1